MGAAQALPLMKSFKMNYNQIINDSGLPWLELDIEIPHQKMLEEAIGLKDRFVKHRDQDGNGGYRHKGWRSLCIHGIDAEKTNHFEQYGYKTNNETPYNWTDIIDRCPVTYDFFNNVFPFKKYYRLRYMLLEPEGFITPHNDSDVSKLSPINIALNHPKGCLMKMQKHKGYVPFEAGKSIMLEGSKIHAYVNNSKEDRYHIIVHGIKSQQFEKLVEDSYEKNGT